MMRSGKFSFFNKENDYVQYFFFKLKQLYIFFVWTTKSQAMPWIKQSETVVYEYIMMDLFMVYDINPRI